MFKAGQKVRIMDSDHERAGHTGALMHRFQRKDNEPAWVVRLDAEGYQTIVLDDQIIATGAVERVSDATAAIGQSVNAICKCVAIIGEIATRDSRELREDQFRMILEEAEKVRYSANTVIRAAADGVCHGA